MPLSELDPAGPDLTVQEVARYLRVSKTTVYRYLEERLLPGAWLTEKSWRIPQSAVIAYQQSRTAGDGDEA